MGAARWTSGAWFFALAALLLAGGAAAFALGGSEEPAQEPPPGSAVEEDAESPRPAAESPAETRSADPASRESAAERDYAERRRELVERHIKPEGIDDPEVIRAMSTVPRHQFVPDRHLSSAYQDRALPIGEGQTISQPYVVAFMTEKLDLDADDKVLEIGTGSAYQAAVLAEIVKEVYSVEIIDTLAESARERLRRLGYGNVQVKSGDGYWGWEEHAPFDAIIVTAASGHIPPPLVKQLKAGGRIVIPLGGVYEVQSLVLVRKRGEGDVQTEHLLPVRFVPMTGRARQQTGPE